jgi:hypothetical protein
MQAEKLDDFEEDRILPFNFKLQISEESVRENWEAIRKAIEKLEQDSDSL